jgi:4-hydroxybenzoate polyprenyltransferase
MRLDKPIGIYLLLWPSICGVLIAGLNNSFSINSVLIVTFGAILVRTCGCVINDIFDYKIDMQVSRTSDRPLANGSISILNAYILFFLLAISSLALLYFVPTITKVISLITGILIVIYPLTKRFMRIPQIFLGITFATGTLISYSLENSNFTPSIIIFYIGTVSWIIAFDTVYALQDIEDDKLINNNSSAVFWGRKALTVVDIFYLIFFICLVIIGFINKFSPLFYIFILGLFWIKKIQDALIRSNNYLTAFKVNNFVGLTLMLGFTFEYILK